MEHFQASQEHYSCSYYLPASPRFGSKQDSRRCILRCSSSLLPLQVAESSLPYISTMTKQVANLNFGKILTSWAFSSQALRSCLGSTNSLLPLILRPNTAINCISASDVRRNTPQFSSNTSGHLLEIWVYAVIRSCCLLLPVLSERAL